MSIIFKVENPPTFELADCHASHAAHPDTFEIPAHDELECLEYGDFVKLIVEPADTSIEGHRCWFQVVIVPTADRPGLCLLDSVLPDHFPLEHDTLVAFELRHIAAVFHQEGWSEEECGNRVGAKP